MTQLKTQLKNNAYNYFETAHKKTTAKIIPLKQKLKKIHDGKQMIYVINANYYMKISNSKMITQQSIIFCISTRYSRSKSVICKRIYLKETEYI